MWKLIFGIMGLCSGVLVGFLAAFFIHSFLAFGNTRFTTSESFFGSLMWSSLGIGAIIGCLCGVKLGSSFSKSWKPTNDKSGNNRPPH